MNYNDIYRPSKFTIGYSDQHKANSSNESMVFGFPSCRWIKAGKWTELGFFTSNTGGYKPHSQRDAEKQLKKDLGLKVEEIDNEPIGGFRLVEMNHGYRSGTNYAVVRDPRGFCLRLDERFVERVVLKWKLGISGGGEIEGKWFYAWQNERFVGIKPESALAEVTVDDSKLEDQSKELKSFQVKDLVAGKVYDMCASNGDKSNVERVVYLGEIPLPNLPSVRNFFAYGYRLNTLGRYWDSAIRCTLDETVDWLPWNDASTAKKSLAVMKPWKPTPAFIELTDEIQNYQATDSWYCDDLAGLPEEDKEHSIRLCFDGRYDGGNFIAGKDIVKRLVNESESQDVKIITKDLTWSRKNDKKFKYLKPSEFKIMTLESLKKGVNAFLKKMKAAIDDRVALAPPQVPSDLDAWREIVRDWYNKVYEPERKKHGGYHWW